jgi:MoxR-like ATPase
MSDWQIFQGDNPDKPQPDRLKLPNAPKWRPSGQTKTRAADRLKQKGKTFQVRPEEKKLINSALYLRRPLLVTGSPGVGKSSLAYAVAYELGLGDVLYWPITTRTTLQDGLYSYDAIGRLQDSKSQDDQEVTPENKKDPTPQGKRDFSNIGNYIQLGPLGSALMPSKRPRVLLIDEIDKGDIDLPNDLLCLFEEGGFSIKELGRLKRDFPRVEVQTAYTEGEEQMHPVENGRIDCDEFPFIVMTSNGERDFPAPFLRRCIRLTMQEPSEDELTSIVEAHLSEVSSEAKGMIHDFYERREDLRDRGNLATDQLLNAIYLVAKGKIPQGKEREALLEQLWKPLSSSEDS